MHVGDLIMANATLPTDELVASDGKDGTGHDALLLLIVSYSTLSSVWPSPLAAQDARRLSH